jgi:phenylacetic acid degradation operon negative regulatory protein
MAQRRKKETMVTSPPVADAGLTTRFTARSVIASTMLGVDPPRLPGRLLVRSGELFGIAEGTTRVAMSRMVAAGELIAEDGDYRLGGRLLERHARQHESRAPRRRDWDGEWTMRVVSDQRRTAGERTELRRAMRVLRLAELREGVWLRPDNLAAGRALEAEAIVAAQCRVLRGRPVDDELVALARDLWDLDAWQDEAERLGAELAGLAPALAAGDLSVLASGFVVSAAVLRHLLADPLLPPELLPPEWCGDSLRADYDRYDREYKDAWRAWFRTERDR